MLLCSRALFLVIILNKHFIKPALAKSIEHSIGNMDQVKFDYSLKSISIPSQRDFISELISSVEKFAKNLNWRVFHYLNPNQNSNTKNTFGFNSTNPPPHPAELSELKDMLYDLVINIKFRKYSNRFQKQLKEDIKKINDEQRMIIAADKTTNYYKVTKENHDELLKKHINKDYRKADEQTVKDITKVDKEIAAKLELEDRIYKTSRRQAFITMKDHKPNFQNTPSRNWHCQ